MEKSKLASKVGFIIVGFDILLLIVLVVIKSLRFMDWEEFYLTMALIFPIRGLYVGTVVKYLVAEKVNLKGEDKVTSLYSFTVLTMLILHHVGLTIVIILFGLGGNADISWLRNSIALIETFFGIYLSEILPNLFIINKD